MFLKAKLFIYTFANTRLFILYVLEPYDWNTSKMIGIYDMIRKYFSWKAVFRTLFGCKIMQEINDNWKFY